MVSTFAGLIKDFTGHYGGGVQLEKDMSEEIKGRTWAERSEQGLKTGTERN